MAEIELLREEIDNDQLPAICLHCGDPNVVWRNKLFVLVPRAAYYGLALGWLPGALILLVMIKRFRMRVPLCEAHKNHWLWRQIVVWGSLPGFLLGLAYVTLFLPPDVVVLAWIAAPLTWASLAFVLRLTSISPTAMTGGSITLIGVDERFQRMVNEDRMMLDLRMRKAAQDRPGGATIT